MSEQPVLDGARLLREYLTRVGESVPVFCEKHGLDRIQVQRYLKGDRKHAGVDFAESIERATDGAVPWHSWHSRTLKTASGEAA